MNRKDLTQQDFTKLCNKVRLIVASTSKEFINQDIFNNMTMEIFLSEWVIEMAYFATHNLIKNNISVDNIRISKTGFLRILTLMEESYEEGKNRAIQHFSEIESDS